jgi:hypothetical protein
MTRCSPRSPSTQPHVVRHCATGKIIYEYTAMNPDKHVENTMAAVQKWQAEQKKGS